VSEKVELDGLPQECNLLAISNQWDLLIAGGDSGESIVGIGVWCRHTDPVRCPDTSVV
jgi:hypothetical protein